MSYTLERCLFCKTPLIKSEREGFTCRFCAKRQILDQIHVPLEAQSGLVCVVDKIPVCYFCEEDGIFDFHARMGGWTNGCLTHYLMYRSSPRLGVGQGQLWITHDQVGLRDLPRG